MAYHKFDAIALATALFAAVTKNTIIAIAEIAAISAIKPRNCTQTAAAFEEFAELSAIPVMLRNNYLNSYV